MPCFLEILVFQTDYLLIKTIFFASDLLEKSKDLMQIDQRKVRLLYKYVKLLDTVK